MFFLVSKAFWLLMQPISMVLLLIVLALVLMWLKRRRAAVFALAGAVLIQSVLGYTSLGYLMIRPLEERFAVPAVAPEKVDAIVFLGGATRARPSTARQIAELNDAGDRAVTTFMLAQRYPEARIVLTGGASFTDETETEAVTMQRFLTQLGVAPERLVLEDEARNTAENAAFSRDLIADSDGEGAVILVTSAFHMPRSVGLFEAQGIDVIPWPTDYRSAGTEGFGLDLANLSLNMETSTIAMREWIGLVAYHLTGRTKELFPGP